MGAPLRRTYVLSLLRFEVARATRALRSGDWAWIGLGGGILLLLGVADVARNLAAHAAVLRSGWLWSIVLPAASALVGAGVAAQLAKLAAWQAQARFLEALPISRADRRGAALTAVAALVLPALALAGAAGAGARLAVAGASPWAWGGVAALGFAAGASLGTQLSLRIAFQPRARDAARGRPSLPAGWLGWLDARAPSWIGAWAWDCAGGRVPLAGWTLAGVGLAAATLVPIGASLARHAALPAAPSACLAGLAIFMLSLRCHPLRSTLLRTAPIGFLPAWWRHLRLPLALSCGFFLVPAAAALAAAPGAWQQPVGSGLWLLALDLGYAIFAAYFAGAPGRAAIGFVAAVAYADYETLEYGRTVLLALAGLFVWMSVRARRRFVRG